MKRSQNRRSSYLLYYNATEIMGDKNDRHWLCNDKVAVSKLYQEA